MLGLEEHNLWRAIMLADQGYKIIGEFKMTQFRNAYVTRPNDIHGGDQFCYVVVAVVDEGNHLWAAYRGLADTSPEDVASNGDKISQEAAESLFPSLANSGLMYNY